MQPRTRARSRETRLRQRALLAAALGGLTLVACGAVPSEQQVLTDFFEASRVRDVTLLARIAAVTFEPRTDGSVQQFEIVDVGVERTQPDRSTIAKRVIVNAQVRTPDGQVVPKSFVVTMQLRAGERRWFITAFTLLPALRTSP